VLIISNPCLSENGNNGKTFLSLFKEFKYEEVYQLYFNNEEPYKIKGDNFFRVTNLDILKYIFSFGVVNSYGVVKKNETFSSYGIQSPNVKLDLLKKVYRNLLFKILPYKKIDNWVSKIKPDAIFFVGTNYTYSYNLLNHISKKFNIPYCIYFTDDYLIYNNGNNLIEKTYHKVFLKSILKKILSAKQIFVISPKMAREYDTLFNKKCKLLINAMNTHSPTIFNNKKSSLKMFRYFGWLHSNRINSIIYLYNCLKLTDIDFIIEVYTFSKVNKSQYEKYPNIRFFTPVYGEEYKKIISSSDFLIHSESFDKQDTKITSLSISTKITEYLISNKCIIAIGPKEIASIEILINNNLAIVLKGNGNEHDDIKMLANIVVNDELYTTLINNASNYCLKTFNSELMRKDLRESLFY
jgi:hypothetical protein